MLRSLCPAVCLVILIVAGPASGQNKPFEVGILFAAGGQSSLSPAVQNEGFFQSPVIEHLYFGFLTNGVQSLSVFLEHVNETRERDQIWSSIFFGGANQRYPSHVAERLFMTTLGLETYRTFISESGFRVAAGIGLGYGLGNASIDVTNTTTGQLNSANSCSWWSGLIITGSLRMRYSIYTNAKYDVGIIAIGRYWGFPAIAPIGDCPDAYNGPSTRVLNELGYLAGLSVGF